MFELIINTSISHYGGGIRRSTLNKNYTAGHLARIFLNILFLLFLLNFINFKCFNLMLFSYTFFGGNIDLILDIMSNTEIVSIQIEYKRI